MEKQEKKEIGINDRDKGGVIKTIVGLPPEHQAPIEEAIRKTIDDKRGAK